MRNNQQARNQETTRRILVITIFVLLLLIMAVLIRMLSVKSCSNPGSDPSAMNQTPSPKPETPTPEPEVSVSPIIVEPTQPVLQSSTPDVVTAPPTPIVTPVSTPESNPYGIPRVVTDGSMDDVLARLEQFKTLPASETLILLDVGHGGFDPGTIGIETGVTEADINLQISKLVAEKLAAKGYYVFMTRMGEYACAETKDKDMGLRKRIMKLDIFDAAISIHQNALPTDRTVHGVRMYHYKYGTSGEKLAKSILQAICALTDETRTNTNTGNLMVVREPVAPSALVECGFLSNVEDEKRLSDPSYQAVFAQAVANGIEDFLRGN